MKVEVDLSSTFEGVLGYRHLSVELEEPRTTIKNLLQRLCQMEREKISSLLFENGREESVLSGLMVVVNDRVFTGTALNRENVELHDRDRVSLLYFVSGG